MKFNRRWYRKNLSQRKLIEKNESRITYVQLIGFVLMALGIIYLMIYGMFIPSITAEGMAISFFVIMLGMSFAFPSMLEGPGREISTMRIVVFMIVNVICLLLLKIGWGKEIKSLTDIGLDQYWVGVIAFVFGAKAAQRFFESRMAANREEREESTAQAYTNAEIAKLAIEQNQEKLLEKFPNIVSVSDAVNDLDSNRSHIITIYVEDDNVRDIPNSLPVKLSDRQVMIDTEIVENVGRGRIQVNQLDHIHTTNVANTGSVCCLVKLDQTMTAVVTAGHVYSNGTSASAGGELSTEEKRNFSINNELAGKWHFQRINNRQDIAFAALDEFSPDTTYRSFRKKKLYSITDEDVKTNETNVTLISAEKGVRDGFILDYNVAISVPYSNDSKMKNNIILIGSTANRKTSQTLSKPGDSGGCVFHKNTKRLIGLILGGDNKFTWVLPLEESFQHLDIELL